MALSRTVSKINEFLHFTQKFKMVTKNGRKTIFGKSRQLTLLIPWRSKIRQNHSISHRFPDKCVLAEIQDGRQKWQDIDFWERSPVDC